MRVRDVTLDPPKRLKLIKCCAGRRRTAAFGHEFTDNGDKMKISGNV